MSAPQPVGPADMPADLRAELEHDLALFGSCWWHIDAAGNYTRVRHADVIGNILIVPKPGEAG